uniref:ATPase dynein-related AAA domain-containing protein n=1 Tax=Dictyoglomus turgidum TaxID=513050 RepID=A0A7C3WM59_9BACT
MRKELRIIYERPFVVENIEGYVGELPDLDIEPVILDGPKGIGKTLAVLNWAKQRDYRVLSIECNEEMGYSQIIGCYGAMGQDVYFSLGIIPTIVELAQNWKFVALFEEINALNPSAQKMLNSLLDIKGGVTVKELGSRYSFDPEIRSNVKLVATMNPSFYGGVYKLNEDLRSRFNIIKMGYPDQETEKKILKIHCNDEEIIDKLIRLANETRSGGFVYALSPRDLVQALKIYSSKGLIGMLRILAGKFEEVDLTTYYERIIGLFEVDYGLVR